MGKPNAELEAEIWMRIRQIPHGKCASYGDVGRALSTPTTGRGVGNRLRHIPAGVQVPWWRVIAVSGSLPISKLDPYLGIEQQQRLRAEGVPFKAEHVVDLEACRHEFDRRLVARKDGFRDL
jgi:methylated-DNA-protein-cysteine methyltransferase-like protein